MTNRLLWGAALCFGLAAPPGLLRAQDDYEALAKEYRAASSAFNEKVKEMQQAKKSREEISAWSQANNPAKDFVERFRAGAKSNAGTDAAVPYLLWLSTDAARVDPKITAEALTTLLTDHLEHKRILVAVVSAARMSSAIGAEKTRALLSGVIEKATREEVRIQALFERANLVLSDDEASEEERTAAKDDLRKVAASKADERLAKRAEGQLFVWENLQIGMVAPDIAAKDLDGVEFKLSDYRGKVVVLDFWGDW